MTLLLLLCATRLVHADDEPAPARKAAARVAISRVAWFGSLKEARRVAAETGRPILVALHVRPYIASPDASVRMEAWTHAYRDPRFVALSREFACVARVIGAHEGGDPDVDGDAPSASHLVIDVRSRVLVRADGELDAIGGVGGLLRLLGRALRAHGPVPDDAPRIDEKMVRRVERKTQGVSPMNPIGVPLDAAGLRLRLHWELPAPMLEGAVDGSDEQQILADVHMRWDGEGPFGLGEIGFAAGDEVDLPVDVRFAQIEGLAPLATEGIHRVDLYLVPRAASYPFSKGPLHVGRVYVDLGEGGGGGGGGSSDEDAPQPEPSDPPPPQPVPEGEEPAPPPPKEDERIEVVNPFKRDGETVKKDKAVVAVEDPDGGVKPPKRVPIEEALREFEKQRERAVRREDISPRERELLRKYFESLLRSARSAREAAAKDGK